MRYQNGMAVDPALIKARREEMKLSQSELARRIGVRQQAIAQVESGQIKSPKFIIALARELRLTIEQATGEPGGVPSPRMVPIVGIVNAGGSNIMRSGIDGGLGEVEAPEGSTPQTVAVEVRGNSMGGRLEDGDTVFYDDRREPVTADLIGRLCVCETVDGEVLVKKIASGSRPGLYHLISYNAEPMFDVKLVWAAKITNIRPR